MERIKHPSEVVKVGDTIQVYVKDFDQDRKRTLYKRIEDDPYNNIEERLPVGSIVHGKWFACSPSVLLLKSTGCGCALPHLADFQPSSEQTDEVLEAHGRMCALWRFPTKPVASMSALRKSHRSILIQPEEEEVVEPAEDDLPTSYVDSETVEEADEEVAVEEIAEETAVEEVAEEAAVEAEAVEEEPVEEAEAVTE